MAKSIIGSASKQKAKPKKVKILGSNETSKVSLKITCQDCKRTLALDNFYKNPNDPIGYYRICKRCLCERAIDPVSNEVTKQGLISVLRLIDKPYIDTLWKTIKLKNATSETKVGVYVRTLSNVNYINKFWKDSDAEWSITEEDENLEKAKKYYSDWGGNYTEAEFRFLEKLYDNYLKDFVITDISQKDYTRKICKASLDLDQCTEKLRNGEIDIGRYKLAKDTFDTLSKSAGFTKSERKDDTNLGTFGQIFDLVEKNIWVPTYEPKESEKDIYEELLSQLSNIQRSM